MDNFPDESEVGSEFQFYKFSRNVIYFHAKAFDEILFGDQVLNINVLITKRLFEKKKGTVDISNLCTFGVLIIPHMCPFFFISNSTSPIEQLE